MSVRVEAMTKRFGLRKEVVGVDQARTIPSPAGLTN